MMSLLIRFLILAMFLGASSLFAFIGKVSLLKGEAFVERAGGKLSLKNGMEIEEKDTLYTSKDAQIQLIFEDKTVITLGSQSEFKVEEYLSEGSKPKAKFKFNQGVFKTITGQIGKSAPENFTLETKTATIGIRGTVIGGVVPPPNSNAPDTIFCLGGKITATSRQTGVTVALPTGTMTVVPPSGPPAPPRQVTPQDIQQFNQSLGTPPSASTPSEGSNSQNAQSGKSSQSSEAAQSQESSASQTQESGSTAAAQSSSSDSSTASSSGNNASNAPIALSMNEAPPPPPPSAPLVTQTQITVPTAANAALQTNLQTLSQEVVVQDVANEIGVPVEEIKEQIASGTPIVVPTDPITPPIDPVVPPTDPIVVPTDPITPPTDPVVPPTDPIVVPTDPITPPTDPVVPPTEPTAPPSGGGGGEVVQTCPSGTSGTYPNCVTITTTNFKGYATSRYDSNVDIDESINIDISSDNKLSGLLTIESGVDENYYNFHLEEGVQTVNYENKTFLATDFNTSGTYIETISGSPSDYIVWGKWTSVEMDANLTSIATDQNYWVAGEDKIAATTAIADAINSNIPTTYNYSGKAIGSTYNALTSTYLPITTADSTNKFYLAFNFGNGSMGLDLSKSFLNFTVEGILWDIHFAHGSADQSGDGFYGVVTDNYIGFINGFFYGEDAQAIGGTFNIDRNETLKAYGVFAGNQAPLSLSGFATSRYIQNENIIYSYTDAIAIDINHEQIQGDITLSGDRGIFDLSTTATAATLNDINSSKIWTESYCNNSDYVSWGYWAAGEMDNNATLMAGNNYWVVGSETPDDVISGIAPDTIYGYHGNVVGSLSDGTTSSNILMNENNIFNLEIKFGSANPIAVTQMKFETSTHGIVDSGFITPDHSTTSTSSISGNTFIGKIIGSQVDNVDLKGKFFGPNAEAIGGAWSGSFNNGAALSGTGVFKGVKQ